MELMWIKASGRRSETNNKTDSLYNNCGLIEAGILSFLSASMDPDILQ